MSNSISNDERAYHIRSLMAHPGWKIFQDTVSAKYEQARDQFLLEKDERHPDMKMWSNDKIAGMSLGLGWAQKVLGVWLNAFEAAQRTTKEESVEEEGHGHPYAPDPSDEVVQQS